MFYDKFIALCAKKNKSPTAVAVELGISRASVTGWKKGAKPRDVYIWMIADHFAVPPDYFYDDYQEQSAEKVLIAAADDKEVLTMKTSCTADRLNEIMRERNLKQIDILRAADPFCKKYGIKLAKNDLSQYVNGKVEPGQEKLTILGLALNVSEAWLMGYDVPEDRDDKKEQPPVTEGLSAQKQAMYDFIDTLSDEQVDRLLQLARVAFEK